MCKLARSNFVYPAVAILIPLLMTITGCASVPSVSVPLPSSAPDYSKVPAASMRLAAMEIEQAIRVGDRELTVENRDDLVLEDPKIQQAIRTRAARAQLVSSFLDTGHGWERRDGRLWIIRTSAYKNSGTKQSRDLDAMMVNSENRDRWTLYETIVKVNDLPNRSHSAVESIFFEARLGLMDPGQVYETETGEPAILE